MNSKFLLILKIKSTMAEKRTRRNKEKLASSKSESNSNDPVNDFSNDSLRLATVYKDPRIRRDTNLTFLTDPLPSDEHDDYPPEEALHNTLLGIRY